MLISFEVFSQKEDEFLDLAMQWCVFVYPTDTVYWIGSIINKNSINKIFEIKKRSLSKNLSVIAPNIEWIIQNFDVNDKIAQDIKMFLNKYHGITLLLNKRSISSNLDLVSNNAKVWVRIIKHWFQDFVSKLNQPFITTSANISWAWSINSISQLDNDIYQSVDYIIDDWELIWKPSVIIDYDSWDSLFRDK